MNFNFAILLDHDPVGVSEVAEDLMIIPIIVISFFERFQRLVENVSRDDLQSVHDDLSSF